MHGTIAGITGSGKTFLAMNHAAGFIKAGIKTLVLRKPGEIWPAASASWQTEDVEAFLSMFDRARRCVCYMELPDSGAKKNDERIHLCFSRGRMFGHRCFFLTQRAAQVHPTIRENCTELFLFTSAAKGAAVWAEEFADPELEKAATLPQFAFLHKATRFSPTRFYPRLK